MDYLTRTVRKLKEDLKRYQQTKDASEKGAKGIVSKEWILRVMLASVHSSARALAVSFRLCNGTDENTVSRPTITKIKSTWAAMYVPMVLKAAKERIQVE